jgi:hypothetical protein
LKFNVQFYPWTKVARIFGLGTSVIFKKLPKENNGFLSFLLALGENSPNPVTLPPTQVLGPLFTLPTSVTLFTATAPTVSCRKAAVRRAAVERTAVVSAVWPPHSSAPLCRRRLFEAG